MAAIEAGSKRRRVEEDDHDKVLQINVGGRVVFTSRATLCSQPGSMLAALFDANSNFHRQTHDDEGRPFLDRHPDLFEYVLEFLRSGRFTCPTDLSTDDQVMTDPFMLSKLMAEAEYFGLDQMLTVIRTRLRRHRAATLVSIGLGVDVLKQSGFSAYELWRAGLEAHELFPLCSTEPVQGLQGSRTAASMPLVIAIGQAGSGRVGLMKSLPKDQCPDNSGGAQMVWTKIPTRGHGSLVEPLDSKPDGNFGDLCKVSDLVGAGGGVRYCRFDGDPIVGSTGVPLTLNEWWKRTS